MIALGGVPGTCSMLRHRLLQRNRSLGGDDGATQAVSVAAAMYGSLGPICRGIRPDEERAADWMNRSRLDRRTPAACHRRGRTVLALMPESAQPPPVRRACPGRFAQRPRSLRSRCDPNNPRLLAANPDPAQTDSPTGLDLDVANAAPPPRISVGVRPAKERNIKHVVLRAS